MYPVPCNSTFYQRSIIKTPFRFCQHRLVFKGLGTILPVSPKWTSNSCHHPDFCNLLYENIPCSILISVKKQGDAWPYFPLSYLFFCLELFFSREDFLLALLHFLQLHANIELNAEFNSLSPPSEKSRRELLPMLSLFPPQEISICLEALVFQAQAVWWLQAVSSCNQPELLRTFTLQWSSLCLTFDMITNWENLKNPKQQGSYQKKGGILPKCVNSGGGRIKRWSQSLLMDRIRGNGHKVKYRKFHLNGRKIFYFTLRLGRHWKRCPERLQSCHPWVYQNPTVLSSLFWACRLT